MTEPDSPVTLDNCESEPIHVPGAIQPHGVLFACNGSDLRVSQVSANVAAFFGVPAEGVIGRSLADFFSEGALRHLCDPNGRARIREANPFRSSARSGQSFDAVAHESGESLIVELEPCEPGLGDQAAAYVPTLR
jgi:chemotaxis family two-component system sensor kinase Cph1